MTQLPVRTLGKNGPLVTAIGLGCMGLGNSYTTKGATEVERLAFLGKAFELGSTFWVTSDVCKSFRPIFHTINLGLTVLRW